MAIWHTQRPQRSQPTRQTALLYKTLPRRPNLPNTNNTFSDSKQQEIGVPQGSILSVILFMIKINKITTWLLPEINGSLYVDDFFIC